MKIVTGPVKILCSFLIAVPLLISSPAYAAGVVNIPPQAEGLVDEQDILEMVMHMAYARSAELLAYLDALDEVMTPVLGAVSAELGDDMPKVTDLKQLRSSYIAKLESISTAGSIAKAEELIGTLQSEAEAVGRTMSNLEIEMRALEPLLRARAGEIETELRAQIDAEVQIKAAEIEEELNRIGEEKGDAAKAAVQAQAAAYAKSTAGKTVDMNAVNAQVERWIAESKARITAEMNALVPQKEEEIGQWAEQRALELQEEQFHVFKQIQEGFENINGRIEAIAAGRRAFYESHYADFLNIKREVVTEAMEPQYQAAVSKIKEHEVELNLAVQEGKAGIPSMNELLQELDANWQNLISVVMNAEHPEDIDEAVAGFKGYWEAKQTQLELALSGGIDELIRTTLEKLNENDTEKKLTEAKAEMTSLIAELEIGGVVPADGKSKLQLMKEILPIIDDALDMIKVFKEATSDDDMAALLELKDRIQARLSDIVSLVNQLNNMVATGGGIYIEAEHESYTDFLPYTESWHSHEELNDPTWRPPLSGGGLWYFSRAPETLGYYFTIESEGDYVIWLRDIASTDWPAGARKVHIVVDGTDYGAFSEHPNRTGYPKGTMEWHTTATVHLTPGQHTLEIKKLETTGAGGLIDAIYITKYPGDDPRMMELR